MEGRGGAGRIGAASLLHLSPETNCLPRSGEEGGVLPTAAYLGFPDGELCSVDSFLLWLRDRGTILSVDSLEPDTGQQITYRFFER